MRLPGMCAQAQMAEPRQGVRLLSTGASEEDRSGCSGSRERRRERIQMGRPGRKPGGRAGPGNLGGLLPFPKEEPRRRGSSLTSLKAMSKGSLSLKDVTVDFTQDEWQQLDPAQKALYRDVMLENYGHLISVGFHITKPDMIRKLEQGEELWTERMFPSQSYLGVQVLYLHVHLHVHLQARRGHQIPLEMVGSYRVRAGNCTQDLWKSSQCS
ncbi:zinc finger protein 382 isoform X8 [Peromyscus californicus insignis]|uniref:zinc finger protein 382 isoform X8 n=1 Tax=Peromyscus californicus insignis TaxID=564181 RepID=UPI0022A674BB|nr:zinc finger protein 382 isoform X8 [Peromyscus californicus insignis]